MFRASQYTLLGIGLFAACMCATATDRSMNMTYNSMGLVDSVDGPRVDVNDITHYSYDANGRLSAMTDAMGHVTRYDTYDTYGHPGRIIDPNGVVTLFGYAPEGWLTSMTRDANGSASTTTLTYDAVGNIVQSVDADGVITKYTYDQASRLIDVADALGEHVHYTLDAAGNRLKEETFDATGGMTRSVARTYNSLSQILSVIDGMGRTVVSFDPVDGYDAAGHPVHSVDVAGIQRKKGYDALNRLVAVIDDYNGSDPGTRNSRSISAFDGSDNLEGFSDQDGLATTYDHNGLGDITRLSSPDTGVATFTYDAAGNQVTRTDAREVVTTFAYDALNRRIKASYADSTLDISYGYDEADAETGCSSSFPIGRLTRIREAEVITTYCYDARGNVVQKKQSLGGQSDVVAYTYSSGGRLATEVRPSGSVTEYRRDALGRINEILIKPVGGAAQSIVSGVTYLPFGPVRSYVLGNGQAVTRAYDLNYSVTAVVSPALSLHFERDAMGHVTALTQGDGGPILERYSYDSLYRLRSINDPSGASVEAYTYSNAGDRLSKMAPGLYSGLYSYQSGTHRLITIGTTSRAYDANGSTTGMAGAGSVLGYGYNGRGRLTVIQRDGATVGTYIYNALGQRVEKTATFPTLVNVRFSYGESGQIIGEYGALYREYFWLGDIPVAVLSSSNANTVTTYVHADALGSPRAVTDETGAILWSWPYRENAFGELAPVSTSGYVLNLRFPGQYYDAESGLNYNLQRYYEPATGRYLQSDPIGLNGGANTFAYTSSRPLNFIDFMGLAAGPPPMGPFPPEAPGRLPEVSDIPAGIPGGPWEPAKGQRPGDFWGPKQPGGGRTMCRWVPSDEAGGPPGSQGYWKTQAQGTKGWSRYDQAGNPISPEEAHPGPRSGPGRGAPLPEAPSTEPPALEPAVEPVIEPVVEPVIEPPVFIEFP